MYGRDTRPWVPGWVGRRSGQTERHIYERQGVTSQTYTGVGHRRVGPTRPSALGCFARRPRRRLVVVRVVPDVTGGPVAPTAVVVGMTVPTPGPPWWRRSTTRRGSGGAVSVSVAPVPGRSTPLDGWRWSRSRVTTVTRTGPRAAAASVGVGQMCPLPVSTLVGVGSSFRTPSFGSLGFVVPSLGSSYHPRPETFRMTSDLVMSLIGSVPLFRGTGTRADPTTTYCREGEFRRGPTRLYPVTQSSLRYIISHSSTPLR